MFNIAPEQRSLDALRKRAGTAPANAKAMTSRIKQRQARRLHRWVVPIAAAPLLLTAGTGSLYSLLLEQNIDAFWLLKIHTGNLGWINLQPIYPIVLGVLTLVVTGSGIVMLLPTPRQSP